MLFCWERGSSVSWAHQQCGDSCVSASASGIQLRFKELVLNSSDKGIWNILSVLHLDVKKQCCISTFMVKMTVYTILQAPVGLHHWIHSALTMHCTPLPIIFFVHHPPARVSSVLLLWTRCTNVLNSFKWRSDSQFYNAWPAPNITQSKKAAGGVLSNILIFFQWKLKE